MEFCGLFAKELSQWLQENQQQGYRVKQLFNWVYQKGILDWDQMTNVSKSLRDLLKKEVSLPTLTLQEVQDSDDQETKKFLWKLRDSHLVESVLICSGNRRTVCISSQVGCPARCSFCASGKEGLIRNLTTGEIVEQALLINRYLREKGEEITHLVFMGMGEPLENYEAVLKSVKIFIHPEMFNLSCRRITISTVGVIEGIKRLIDEDIKINLVLSLHASNQKIRKKIIPYARRYPLEDILDAVNQYTIKTKRDITYEYILLANINDGEEEAKELAALLKGKQCSVNLIPYNPVSGLKLKRPDKNKIMSFRSTLFRLGIRSTQRYTKGKDIAAACGQLALKNLDKSLYNLQQK